MAKARITIMLDFGNCPYAWLNENPDLRRGVGPNVADSVTGFCGMVPVSAALEAAFSEWAWPFESEYNNPDFDWEDFHRAGIELARRLKDEVGDAYDVVYLKASEDPNYAVDERTEIN